MTDSAAAALRAAHVTLDSSSDDGYGDPSGDGLLAAATAESDDSDAAAAAAAAPAPTRRFVLRHVGAVAASYRALCDGHRTRLEAAADAHLRRSQLASAQLAQLRRLRESLRDEERALEAVADEAARAAVACDDGGRLLDRETAHAMRSIEAVDLVPTLAADAAALAARVAAIDERRAAVAALVESLERRRADAARAEADTDAREAALRARAAAQQQRRQRVRETEAALATRERRVEAEEAAVEARQRALKTRERDAGRAALQLQARLEAVLADEAAMGIVRTAAGGQTRLSSGGGVGGSRRDGLEPLAASDAANRLSMPHVDCKVPVQRQAIECDGDEDF